MVLSLFEICRVSLRNSIESGRLPDWQQLPPKLRQSILDLILMHGTIDNPNCLEIIGSIDFFRDFTTLDTRKGIVVDYRFLDRVTELFSMILPNGATIGSAIEGLNSNLYFRDSMHLNTCTARNFANAIRLISKCSSLQSLALKIVEANKETNPENDSVNILDLESADCGLLNVSGIWQPCLPIIKNLVHLSLVDRFMHKTPLLINGIPIIQFKNLASLKIKGCIIPVESWPQFLESIQGTLTDLHLEDMLVKCGSDHPKYSYQMALPVSLRRLERFAFEMSRSILADKCDGLIENLTACQSLEYASLTLFSSQINQRILAALTSKARLDFKLIADSIPNMEMFNRFVDIFGPNIKEFGFGPGDWNIQFAKALGLVLNGCPNLVELKLTLSSSGKKKKGAKKDAREMADSQLISFFNDPSRSGKLRNLSLEEPSAAVLDVLFHNCPHLDELDISRSPHLTDAHLIEWANRGAAPRQLAFDFCENLGDKGLIPILINSGTRLTHLDCYESLKITDRAWKTLIDRCPYCVVPSCYDLEVMPHSLVKEWVEKRFSGPNDEEIMFMNCYQRRARNQP